MSKIRLKTDSLRMSDKGIAIMNRGRKSQNNQRSDWLSESNTKGESGMNVAYVRVSTVEQNEQRQIEALKNFKINKWFIDKCSGKDTNR